MEATMVSQDNGDSPKMPGLHGDCGEESAVGDISSNAKLDLVAELIVRTVYDLVRRYVWNRLVYSFFSLGTCMGEACYEC